MSLARNLQRGGVHPITSPLHPDLLAMYTMDNISGSTLVDESPNGNDGTINGASAVTGKIGNALQFTASESDYVDCGFTGAGLTQGAVSMWVTRDVNAVNHLISRATAGSNNDFILFQIELNTGEIRIVAATAAAATSVVTSAGSISVSTTTFHHVVIQSDGASWDIWLNGVQQSLSVDLGTNTGDWFGDLGTDNIQLGRLNRIAADYGTIKQDMVRFSDRPYTAAEISQLYNGGAGA